MSYNYTVQAGDSLNSIAQAHGFANYKDAGITSVPSGNFDKINPNETITLNNYDPSKVSTIAPTSSPVVSSTDNTQQYKTDSNTIDTLIGSLNKKVDPLTKEVTSTTDTTKPNAPIDPVTGQPKVDTTATDTTGNAVFDNLQKEAKSKADALTAKQAQDKIDYTNLWNTSLANLNASTASTISAINTTYDKRIAEQNRINNLNIDRVKAYGLANGGQYTPIAFSDSVTNREREASDLITSLESQRNDLINKANMARNDGETALMRQHLTDLQTIDDKINNQLKDVQATAEKNYQDLRNARIDAENKHKAQVAEALTSLQATAPSMVDAYTSTDSTGQDAIIKKIVAQTGLDYGQVYATLEGAVTKKQTNSLDLRKKTADVQLAEKKVVAPAKTTKPAKVTADQEIGSAIAYFKNNIATKGWKGVNPDEYKQMNDYLNTTFGYSATTKFQKALDTEGLMVDNSSK